jgi:hypothetical protein
MKIGDKVTYDDESVATTDHVGTVVKPTDEELEESKTFDTVGPQHGDVRVEWADGVRYWEHPSYLVVIQEAGA